MRRFVAQLHLVFLYLDIWLVGIIIGLHSFVNDHDVVANTMIILAEEHEDCVVKSACCSSYLHAMNLYMFLDQVRDILNAQILPKLVRFVRRGTCNQKQVAGPALTHIFVTQDMPHSAWGWLISEEEIGALCEMLTWNGKSYIQRAINALSTVGSMPEIIIMYNCTVNVG